MQVDAEIDKENLEESPEKKPQKNMYVQRGHRHPSIYLICSSRTPAAVKGKGKWKITSPVREAKSVRHDRSSPFAGPHAKGLQSQTQLETCRCRDQR